MFAQYASPHPPVTKKQPMEPSPEPPFTTLENEEDLALHPKCTPPSTDLAGWLADALQSERVFVNVMLEQKHETILNDLRRQLRMTDTKSNNAFATTERSNNSDECLAEYHARSPQLNPIGRVYDANSFNESGASMKNDCHLEAQQLAKDVPKGSQDRALQRMATGVGNEPKPEVVERVRNSIHKVSSHADLYQTVEKGWTQFLSSLSESAYMDVGPRAQKIMPVCELFLACVILVNICTMALERQYVGFDVGSLLADYPGSSDNLIEYQPGEETWPWAKKVLFISEMIVGAVFGIEVFFLMAVFGFRYFASAWNLFDLTVVIFWAVDFSHAENVFHINPILLRIAPMVRVARLLRFVRTIGFFHALHVILTSVKSSFLVLFWSLFLLLLMLMVVSVFMSQILVTWILDESHDSTQRINVFLQWGTFSRSMVTMFEVTLGNWGPPCRILQEEVSEWWVIFFIVYKCVIGFAVVQVITGVFMQQTFKVVARDEQIMINEKKLNSSAVVKNLEKLFEVIDASGDNALSLEELTVCLDDPTVKAWFAALEVDESDATKLFDFLEDGSGKINRRDFIVGIKQIRGHAKSIDLQHILSEVRAVSHAQKMLAQTLSQRGRQGRSHTAPEPFGTSPFVL
eukprot:TRINITY_DN12787_c1_g3_i1.p1 TRINITY_DN12787_c1_g3~~TRINITY_DN12787_c1_g3_i1.p1  ORF type:complete len:632 (+),score=97.76 TRINITY_DN12787_c1_g3_i1:86-1981(+)